MLSPTYLIQDKLKRIRSDIKALKIRPKQIQNAGVATLKQDSKSLSRFKNKTIRYPNKLSKIIKEGRYFAQKSLLIFCKNTIFTLWEIQKRRD